MMDREFTMDELAVVNIYKTGTRAETIRNAMFASAYVNNDIMDLMASAIAKLVFMSEEEFQALNFEAVEYLAEEGWQ